jgi:uncharacterized RDD family membrane protein YckC
MEVVSYNNYVGFTRRFIAFIIDRILIWLLFSVLLGYAEGVNIYSIFSLFGTQTIVVEILVMVYFVVCETSSWQGTLGKHLLNMKVVNEQYQKVTASQAMWRFTWKYLSFFVLLLGFIWVIFDTKKQGWHDKLAGTYVIEN